MDRRASRSVALGLLLGLLASGLHCARKPGLDSVPRRQPFERGIASWYGDRFHGRRTASGERYDMHALTAAHRALPFGARVRVVNLENGRAIEVRINDRGPSVPGRILDLSRAAAAALHMVDAGVARVEIYLLEP